MKTYGRVEVQLHRVDNFTLLPLYSPREKAPGTHCVGEWVGPRAGLGVKEKGKVFCPCLKSNPNSSVVQPLA
jgi:hypothetical protein